MAYLFSHFTNDGKEDKEQIWFSVSRDGLNWTDLGSDEPLLYSSKGTTGIRDPFVLYDEKREKCIVHPYRGEWYLRTKVNKRAFHGLEETDSQKFFEMLFKEFCKTIAIKERKNEKLQQNMLPLHFRDCMVEFSGDKKS